MGPRGGSINANARFSAPTNPLLSPALLALSQADFQKFVPGLFSTIINLGSLNSEKPFRKTVRDGGGRNVT
jgi:hypothetical protein